MPDRARDIMELLVGGGVGAGVVGGFWAWLNGRPTGQAALITAAASLQAALNEAAEKQMSGLRDEIAGLKSEHEECRRETDKLRKQVETLQGELRQNKQTTDSLIRLLRDPKSTQPGGPLHGALIRLEEGGVEVYPQATLKRTRARRRKPDV